MKRCGHAQESGRYDEKRFWSEQIYMRKPHRAEESTGRRSRETQKKVYISIS